MAGHRQPYTELFIKGITAPGGESSSADKEAPVRDPDKKKSAAAAPKKEAKAAKPAASKKAAKKKTTKKKAATKAKASETAE